LDVVSSPGSDREQSRQETPLGLEVTAMCHHVDLIIQSRDTTSMSTRISEILAQLLKESPVSIKDINDQYNYEDTKGGGKRDSLLVSCGQCGDYNELQYIYDEKLKRLVSNFKITESQALLALSECCSELSNPRSRSDFYKLLSKKLGHNIE
jgi:hypothetical protein